MSNRHVLCSVAMAAKIIVDKPSKYKYPVMSAEEYSQELKRMQNFKLNKTPVN